MSPTVEGKTIMAKTNETNNVVATQTFKPDPDKTCKHVVKFLPDGQAEVGSKMVDEISSSVYVDKRVLDLLGNPDKIIVTVAAAK